MNRHSQLIDAILLLLAPAILGAVQAEERLTYRIQRATTPIQVDGQLEAAWKEAPSVGDFQFPWWQQGR